MKKTIYAAMLLLGLSMMVSCGDSSPRKNDNKVVENSESAQQETEPVQNLPRVYANAFDASVNIYETPGLNVAILGVFRNGPEGAAMLGSEGDWTKIDCNGVVGYVRSKYVQNTPTVAYYGTATLDDIAGIYYGDYGMYLWYDGTWERGYDWPCEYGHYILQNNEVKLIPDSHCVDGDPAVWEDYDDVTAEANSEILPIDLANHKIGIYHKNPFITQKDIEKAKAEYEDEWEMMLYGDYPRLMTKEEFMNQTPVEQPLTDQTFTVNGVSFVMKDVNGGTFQMGTDNETSWERPAHRVTVSDFAIGETEVTQGLWKAVMGSNPSRYQGDELPVDDVSYNDIVNKFLPKLNQMTGQNFRLPTEAEWEFAARGGNNSNGYKYAGSNSLDNVAWYWKNTGDNYLSGTDDDWNWDNIVNNNGSTRNVKGKSPNELGIYGMSGNVWEWCSDEWHSYKSGSENNPKYQGNSKSSRVQRGGCWCSRTGDCRVTFRSGKKPEEHYPKWGFRIALSR